MDNNFENVTFHHRTLCKQLSQSLLLCNIKCSLDIKILFLTLLSLCSPDEWTFRVYFEGDSIFFYLDKIKQGSVVYTQKSLSPIATIHARAKE